MYHAGVIKLIDIFNLDTGRIYEYQEFDEMYPNVVDFVTYYGIVNSVPQQWKRELRRNEPSVSREQKLWIEKFEGFKHKKVAKQVYQLERNTKSHDMSVLSILWNNDLRVKTEEEDIKKILKRNRKITVSEKLRFFQYRLVTRTIKTNVHVSKWKDITPHCTFCQTIPETVPHLFFECGHVRKIWQLLARWLKHFHKFDVKFTLEIVIFNDFL